MRGRVVASFIAATAAACLVSAPVQAAPGDSTNTDTDTDTGSIIPSATQVGWTGGNSSGSDCVWTPAAAIDGNGDDPVFAEPTREGPNGTERLYVRSGCGPSQLFWVPPVDVADLRADAYDSVSRQLPLPSTNISPDPASGGYVNFGLWLAVDDPGPVSATAAVGPVWVTITATYSTSTWNMGTGNPFDCDGLGTPIVDANTDEQGPCGFTYDKPSAPRFTGAGLAYKASVTGTWTIAWVDYTGATGGMAPLARTTPFDYRVREIQTVGVADQ